MANIPTVAWAETTPAGTDVVSAGDDRIRELKTQIREVVDVDHKFDSSGQGATFGYHTAPHLIVQVEPTAVADTFILYSKDVSSKAELHGIDEDGNALQITSAGVLLEDHSALLALAGGTMSGDIAMGTSQVTGMGAHASNGDGVRFEHTTISPIEHAAGSVGSDALATSAVTAVKHSSGLAGELKVGTYAGDGGTTQDIPGIGFQPGILILWCQKDGRDVVFKTSSDPGFYSMDGDGRWNTDMIRSLDDGSFTVGDNDRVNDNGETYTYIALKVTA